MTQGGASLALGWDVAPFQGGGSDKRAGFRGVMIYSRRPVMGYELLSFESAAALSRAVAVRWAGLMASAAIKPEGNRSFGVALSGGRIARAFLTDGAEELKLARVDLSRLHLFWGDERCVGPEDAESNFRLVSETFLRMVRLEESQIHRIRGELDPAVGAVEAEKELRAIQPKGEAGWPVLDLVFLGMGEDGHVASLFPGAPEDVVNSEAAYVPVIGPKPPPQRISLTYGVLKAAREVWVLASGAGKEAALKESLSAQGNTPLARVLASRAHTVVFTDIAHM